MNIEEYKKSTGVKRFRRTKDELARGLSDEQALRERLSTGSPNQIGGRTDAPVEIPERKARRVASDGDIVIRIRADKNVDPIYFEHVPKAPLEIVLDKDWYSWYDTKMQAPYEGTPEKLIKHILDIGLGEVITRIHFQQDVIDQDEITQ